MSRIYCRCLPLCCMCNKKQIAHQNNEAQMVWSHPTARQHVKGTVELDSGWGKKSVRRRNMWPDNFSEWKCMSFENRSDMTGFNFNPPWTRLDCHHQHRVALQTRPHNTPPVNVRYTIVTETLWCWTMQQCTTCSVSYITPQSNAIRRRRVTLTTVSNEASKHASQRPHWVMNGYTCDWAIDRVHDHVYTSVVNTFLCNKII